MTQQTTKAPEAKGPLAWMQGLKPFNSNGLKSLTLPGSPAVAEAERVMDLQRGLDGPRKHISRESRRRMRNYRQQAAAIQHIRRLPGHGETFHMLVGGEYSLWAIVPAILKLAARRQVNGKPARIETLWIATLSFSLNNIAELFALFDAKQIGRMALIVSHYFSATSKKEHEDAATGFASRGQAFASIRSHAKVICVRLSDGTRLTVESSANLRSCKNIEQITLINDPAVYRFHSHWMRQMCRQEKDRASSSGIVPQPIDKSAEPATAIAQGGMQ